MTRKGWHRAVCCALAAPLLLVAGCASDKVTGLQRRAAMAAPQGPTASVCAFSLGGIDDQRDAQSLGQMGRTHIDGAGFDAWFRSGIASMPGYTGDAGAPAIRVTVLKAYVHGLASLKSANLVVRVQFPPDVQGAGATTKTYRGFNDSMNWSTSESEIQEAFNTALDSLTTQIGADLKKRCKG
ncbi:hypothetical protein [Variovorax sp. PAMC26660]|uniref:hypothetical protein n=1 Tax=Variovorax sp. PAMC26660 TaxID=2762322 RepID=UPI00164E43AB|nr:hypothetical protein [Variovorax sp. PAMC26660]QNK71176.1 hypothetical protein H7F35_16505 [Variovorax sp. PAMC26660]